MLVVLGLCNSLFLNSLQHLLEHKGRRRFPFLPKNSFCLLFQCTLSPPEAYLVSTEAFKTLRVFVSGPFRAAFYFY